eukprot:273257_1
MTSLHRTWLVLLQVFAQMHSFESQLLNEWISSIDADGTQRWQSVSDFIPVQSKSFGSIAVGEIMSIEFDFVWWGRTNLPSAGKFEMFFRVGFDASISRGCDGQGARYPSFWLTGNNVDTMHVSVSNGTQCQPSLSLNSYGSISKGVSYHVSIAFNSRLVQVCVSGGGKADWSATWPRQPTPQQYIGAVVPIWWMSNKHPEDLPLYNRGNATFSNIILTSFTPTPAPTTAIPTTDAPTAPSFAPTTPYPTITPSATPTSLPTRNPSTQASTSPTIHPSDAPTTRAPTTAAPTTHPSETPTTNPSETPTTTHAPTRTGETYPPTTHPTTLPTIEPTLNPTNKPTVDPTTKPTTAPSAQEKTEQLYATTTRYIRDTIEVTDLLRSQEEEEGEEETADRDEYEYVEITIFATVISLCFCTVISFLAYLTFKRKVREMQKKRKSSPKYHMELNGADMDQMPSKLELNGDSKSSNHGENANRNYLQSPLSEEHQANGIDSVYLSLDKYKSDSGPHSHLSISVMNMKDATPTPAVSPNENNARHVKSPNNDKEIALVMGNVDDITPVQTVRETIGDKIDSEEDEKGYKQANIRRKDKKEYAAVKRQRMEMDKEEPYEQELDGYGVGLYTTPIVRNYGPYRKNTENTEGYESDNSDNTDFYNSYNGQRMKKRGYEWIKRTLTRVDSQNYDEYVKNFERHKVADTRLGDLLPEDWKELIPVIGPRNEFKRLWAKYNSNLVFKTNGELMEDEETTVPEEEDIAVDLGNDLLAQLISNNDEALLMNERKQKENEQSIHLADDYVDKDVAKLTFDDIKNKFGSHSASNKNDNSVLSSVLSSFISNSEDEERKKSLMSAAESMEISQSYEESQSKSDASGEDGFNYKMRHNKKHKTKTNPIPVAIAEDKEVEEIELKIDQDRLKPGTNSFISPPISPPQYTSHKVYDNPIIARGKNPSLSSSSQSLLSDYSSMSQPPIPDDVDPEELEQPLKEDQSDSDDETLGIPKFHADVSDDSDSSSDESDTETESDAKSDTDEHKEFGQEVDVTIENAIYEDDDEYETDESDEDEHRDDDDEESLSIDMPNSDEDGEED